MKFKKTEGQAIRAGSLVKVKQMKHIVEVMSVLRPVNGFEGIKKLSKTQYVILDTGEVMEYNLSENRGENIAGLKDTFRKIRDLINNNFDGSESELHITLTYAENMTDSKQLYKDFDLFWKRFRRKYGKEFEYISVVEPQGRGAWHCHLLIKDTLGRKIYIPNDELRAIWGKGFVKIKSLKKVDNIGAYLSAYLGDIELTDENAIQCLEKGGTDQLRIKEVEVEGQKKKFIKGGRLHLYPPGMNLYRHSRGIIFPEAEQMIYSDIKKIVGSEPPNYSRTVLISDESDKLLNQVTYEQYNIRRKNNK